jgi:hypothetical protein
MSLIRFVLIAGVLMLGFSFVSRFLPGRSKLMIQKKGPYFPVVSGYNLDRQEFEFPRDFAGEYNLVIVAFQRYHQNIVNTWIPFVQEVEIFHPGFVYYELPTIQSLPALSRSFINEGMRAGIPNQIARERTVTLYLDKTVFRTALEIPDERDIHLLLVDREGNLLWRETGVYTDAKANDLVDFLQQQK